MAGGGSNDLKRGMVGSHFLTDGYPIQRYNVLMLKARVRPYVFVLSRVAPAHLPL